MINAFEMRGVTKHYGSTTALDAVTLTIPPSSIVGLVGRNGSGKSTLLRHVTAMVLPQEGECMTLGRPAAKLGRAELSRIGAVHQHDKLLPWMRAGQLLKYVASFYKGWDAGLERTLVAELELDLRARVGSLSPGSLQKLSLIAASCHHPELLLLDEPLSDLDPMARQAVLQMLLDRFSSDGMTIVLSSHMLRDIEPVIERLVCLERGRVVANDGLDELRESYAEWIVTSVDGRLPSAFAETYVISARGDGRRARLLVRDSASHKAAFAAAYGAAVEVRPLGLEGLFPLLVEAGRARNPAGAERAAGDSTDGGR